MSESYVLTGDIKHSLDGVVPSVRPAFEMLIEQAEQWGMLPRIGDALRTCEEQRGASSSKVRERSWHVLGRAIDVELVGGLAAYRRLGEFWESLGGTWGGRWTDTYPPNGDFQHFQWSGGHDGIPDSVWPSSEPCETARVRLIKADEETIVAVPIRPVQPRLTAGEVLFAATPAAVSIGLLVAVLRTNAHPSRVVLAGIAVAGGLGALLVPLLLRKES